MAKKRIKYLSNSELLHEINESKKTYCYFVDDEYQNYDIIVECKSDLEDSDIINAGKEARAKRLNNLLIRQYILEGKDSSLVKNTYKASDIKEEDIVFRIMTYEHIPQALSIRNTRNESGKYEKVPFPPFKHYAVVNNSIKEVGRSHWVGGLENGEFSPDHGRITDRLAVMFMKLVDRYSTKPNWRGYSYLEEMSADALVHLSAFSLKFNESKSLNPFAYYTQMITNSFRGRLLAEKKAQNLRDELLMQEGVNPSFSKQIDSESMWGGYRSSNSKGGSY